MLAVLWVGAGAEQRAPDLACLLTLVVRHLWSSEHVGLGRYSVCIGNPETLISIEATSSRGVLTYRTSGRGSEHLHGCRSANKGTSDTDHSFGWSCYSYLQTRCQVLLTDPLIHWVLHGLITSVHSPGLETLYIHAGTRFERVVDS